MIKLSLWRVDWLLGKNYSKYFKTVWADSDSSPDHIEPKLLAHGAPVLHWCRGIRANNVQLKHVVFKIVDYIGGASEQGLFLLLSIVQSWLNPWSRRTIPFLVIWFDLTPCKPWYICSGILVPVGVGCMVGGFANLSENQELCLLYSLTG